MNNGMTNYSPPSGNVPDADHLLLNDSAGGGSDQPTQGLWTLVNDRLMGRWKYAIPTGFLFAIVLGFLGYLSTEPKFESSSMVRVAPKIVPIMRETAETGVMPFYSNFVQTQARLIASPRVIERAAQRIDRDEAGWSSHAQAVREISRNLSVRADRQSELIIVSFESDKGPVAQMVVNAVTRAFDELFGGVDGEEFSRKMQTLRNLREDARNQLRQKRIQRQELIRSTDYAVTSFDGLIQQMALTIHQYETELRELQRQLALEFERDPELAKKYENGAAGNEADEGDSQDERVVVAHDIPEADLETVDPQLASLGQQREQARSRFQRIEKNYSPQHRLYLDALNDYNFTQDQYNDRLPAAREAYMKAVEAGTLAVASPATEAVRIPGMMDRVRVLEAEIARQRAVVRELSDKQLTLNDLIAEEAELDMELNEANARIRELEIESDAIRHGRITIAQLGDLPTAPTKDQRLTRMGAGCVAGMGLGLGLFFLLGTLDRRAYGVSQLGNQAASYKLLGILPALGKRQSDFESSAVAAHCVHQVRNQLETMTRAARHAPAITISSPSQGDGKTSLTLALGTSYATAGYRTLLIDCDLIGENLSAQLSLSSQRGLREALRNDSPDEQLIHPSALPNLSIMPCGIDFDFGPEMLRRSDLERLLSTLRNSFDVILMDTGPMLGSVESLPVAMASDGVVLTIWRGGRQSRLDETIDSLRRSGARCYGVVLNYARAADCSYYVSKSNVSKALTTRHADADSTTSTELVNGQGSVTRNALMNAMTVATKKQK